MRTHEKFLCVSVPDFDDGVVGMQVAPLLRAMSDCESGPRVDGSSERMDASSTYGSNDLLDT